MPRKPEEPRRPTRKELSRRERERILQRRIQIGAAILAIAVILIIVGGVVRERVLKPREPVATVNETTVTLADYTQRLNYERFQLFDQMREMHAQVEGADEQTAGFLMQIYGQQIQQLAQQYQTTPFDTLELMIEDELIREKATELGIEVTDEDVQDRIERTMAQRAGAITQKDLDATATAAVDATATASVWTPTPEPTETAVVTETETVTATEAVSPTVTPVLTPTQQPPTPTPNILTDETFQTTFEAYLVGAEQEVGLQESEYRDIVRKELRREKVQDHFAEQVSTEAEQVRLRALVFATEEQAQEAVTRLRAGEGTLDEVAQAIAQQNAGDLGWVQRGQTVGPFEEVAFDLEVDEISGPVETQFGWHIIQVTERDEENARVRARHILVEDEETANEVKQQLDEGGDFSELAREYSTDTASVEGQGAIDVGWVTRDDETLPPQVAEAAFELDVGSYSDPISLDGQGYAVITVEEGPEVRELDPSMLRARQQAAFQDWLDEARADAEIERNLDQSRIPDDPFRDRVAQIVSRYAQAGQQQQLPAVPGQ